MKKTSLTIAMAAFPVILCLGFFAGCTDLLSCPPAKIPEGGNGGIGQVLISLGPREEGARTFMPADPDYGDLSYTYTFSAKDKTSVEGPITGGAASVDLEAGTWTLTVAGADSGGSPVLEGIESNIVVDAGATSSVSVSLKAKTGDGTGGVLNYSVSFPDAVDRGTLTVYRWEDGKIQGTPVDLLTGASSAEGITTKTGGLDLPAGYYRIAIDLRKADGLYSRTDIAHIYEGMTTATGEYTITTENFTPANAETSLAAVLGAISGLSGNKTYLLPAGNESMAAKSISNSNGPVTVTIDGGGRVVTLLGEGSLITVGTNVTLVLKNITLKGRGMDTLGKNNVALVTVDNGGTLELGTGVLITDNRNYNSVSSVFYSRGGGVYVTGDGTFTMSGGEISGNKADADPLAASSYSYGGGVYVQNGTFTMSGGKISGNMAFDHGNGVYVQNGTFTMSGGEISGNTASLYSDTYGGGVYVGIGDFTMSGGEISGNTAFSGGGVYAGNFTMSGGKISGNTISSSAQNEGGGVYASNFTMSGGEISGNTTVSSSSSKGGGVYARNFTMSDGEISGNTASSSSSYDSSYGGGGVYVTGDGTFTMSGGEISGNTASSSSSSSSYSPYSYGGGGVYVADNGTFTMNGGTISGNTASSSYSYSYSYSSYYPSGGGVYGTFTMSDGEISGNSAFRGGGVYGTVTKTGGIIYGLNTGSALKNTAYGGVNYGHAVYSGSETSPKRRNSTAGTGVTLDSSINGEAGGWERVELAPITNITYTSVSDSSKWTFERDGRFKSPGIGDNQVTKMRVRFTSAGEGAAITIQLDVSSEEGIDFAFISALDNDTATYESGYYPGSKISGTQSVTVSIPVPDAGEHSVYICYQKDGQFSSGSDRAWFRVIEE
jgi:hypothetical protein